MVSDEIYISDGILVSRDLTVDMKQPGLADGPRVVFDSIEPDRERYAKIVAEQVEDDLARRIRSRLQV